MTKSLSNDHYPTAECQAARERVFTIHRAYLQLLRTQPTIERVRATIIEARKALAAETQQAAKAAGDSGPLAALATATPDGHAREDDPLAEPPAQVESQTQAEPRAQAASAEAAPEVTSSAEAVVPAAVATSAPGELTPQALENLQEVARRPRAVAERNRLDKLRKEGGFARRAWGVALYLVGIWTVWGLSAALGAAAHQGLGKLGLFVPTPLVTAPIALVLAGLVVFGCVNYAYTWQLQKLAKKGPRDIPYVDTVGHIYEVECYHAEPLNEEQAPQLEKKLETLRKTLMGGKTAEETSEELGLAQYVFGFLAMVFLTTNALYFPRGSAEEVVMAIMLAVAPVAFVFLFTMALSNHSVVLPPLAEELTDPSVAQTRLAANEKVIAEAAAKEAKAQAEREETRRLEKEQAEQRRIDEDRKLATEQAAHDRERQLQREREEKAAALAAKQEYDREVHIETERTINVEFADAQRAHVVEVHDRYADLVEAASAFEAERGYSKKEQEEMQKDLTGLTRSYWWGLLPFSILSGILATYPASLTINEFFGLRDQFFMNNRFALMPWAFWMVVIFGAKSVIIMGRHRTATAEEQHNILNNLYDEGDRITGLRYKVRTQDEVQKAKASARGMFGIGVFLLSLEFAANATYLVQNGDGSRVMGVLLALVPFTLFVALTWPQADNHHKRERLSSSLKWARALPVPAAALDPNAGASSRQARDAYERETVYVDPMSPRKGG